MPPRSTPSPKLGLFSPPNDSATYRDLLLFEERLKTTAASLQRRKARYQLFLFHLLLVIAFLLSEVFLPPQYSLIAMGYRAALVRLPLIPGFEHYKPSVKEDKSPLHPYVTSGLLFVNITTLALFFASGMYTEKIAYANKYVPHTNRALRAFNIYLNVRKPPLRSKFSYWNPLPLLFPRSPSDPSSSPGSARSNSPSREPRTRPRSQSTSRPIAPIPPATNPRGELIFSSRVDRSFRESYERYRAAFERKREEKERAARKSWWCGSGNGNGRWTVWLFGVGAGVGDGGMSTGAGTGTGTPVPPGTPARTISGASSRGRGGTPRSGTPPSTGGGSGGGIMMKSRSRRGTPSTSPSRVDTPVPSLGEQSSSFRGADESPPSPSPSRRGSRREWSMRDGVDDGVPMPTLLATALERSFEQGQSRA